MADSYWRYAPSAAQERDSVPRASFPGYLSSEASFLSAHHLRSPNDLQATPSDYLQKDILQLRPGAYGLDDFAGFASHSALGLGGLTPGATIKGYPSLPEDPALVSQRRDVAHGISRGIPDMVNETPISSRNVEESSILFVDGLPSDCTRREVAHLFRPFIGFKEIRLVHKEPRHSRDKAMVLCFVEFADAKCALTAMEALQGYKFDDKKPDAPSLKIQFAQFPFHPSSSRDDQRLGDLR
ncbi:Rna-binding protein [Thalictrum thalictroides]|uniref:Rna-binding protein n=1 Tax=Thalictrum thalictroides TaxID=46969 RepID=A0A7J6W868_THATH|nr:Rna-binding protein [Thalictrum thalictroides]